MGAIRQAPMQHVAAERFYDAPRQRVWDVYTDHRSWTDWAGIGRVTLEPPGDPDENGVGCVRVIRSGGVAAHEEVVEFQPPERMTYRVVRGGLPGALIEADIQMNARDYRWVEVRGATPFIHARSIIGHELGHLLGLGHTQEADAVMFATYDRGYLVIAADDEAGICALYPRDGAPVACTGGDCPFGRVCDEGVCVPAPTESCVDTMDCAHDEVCFAPLGECIETVLPTDDLGEACTEDDDCQSGRCHDFGEGRVCTSGCDGFNTASCPRGFFCDGRALDQCDIGFCRAGERGEGSLGSECGEDAACASLYCDSGRCAVPCDVTSMSSTECPGSFTCQPGERGCGACLAPRETGAACTSDLECAGAICLVDADGGEGICTQRCNDSSPCPDGLRCDDGTADPVCIQPASGCSGCQGGGSGPGGGFLAHFVTFAAFFCIFAAFRRRTRLL